MKTEGKVAIVTGGASGIGKGVSQRLLEGGVKLLAIFDYNEETGRKAEKEFGEQFGPARVSFHKVDVTSEAGFEGALNSVFDVHKQIDILVNNAGIMDETKARETVLINLFGVINGTHATAKLMSKRNGGNGGVVINTSSIAALYTAGGPVYTATKHGIVGFTRNLPLDNPDFKKAGDMRVAAVCPSGVYTPMMEEAIRKFKNLATTSGERNFLTISAVVDVFMKILEDDGINGDILRITPGTGVEFQQYESDKDLMMKFKIFKNPEAIFEKFSQ